MNSMKAVRSFWTTCLTLLALSLTSVVHSAPLLLPVDQTEPAHVIDESTHLSSHCEDKQEHSVERNNTANNCCSSSCYISVPFSPFSHLELLPAHSLALILSDPPAPLSSFTRALYKPPIA
ncbi:hypothetical protein MACH09_16170 [Vibrio sp. MACH09]|nr:hypothetical protein MACH09_16170 [Vibrio sp. MACH09]